MPPLIGRFVPFAAVAVANAINIPLMRQRELRYGIPVTDKEDNRLGMSKVPTPHTHAHAHTHTCAHTLLESGLHDLQSCYVNCLSPVGGVVL